MRGLQLSDQKTLMILISNWDTNKIHYQEQFYIVLLNKSNRVLGMSLISTGGKASTIADPKIIFSIALKSQASGITATIIRLKI